MNREMAVALVNKFYDALNVPASKDVAGLVTEIATEDWRSYSGEGMSKGREDFIKQVMGFGKMLPDLSWKVVELLVDGDKIVVRSEASGTPAGEFFGVPHTGKSFRIMTIDIHTARDGKLCMAHHVEDWAGAIRQLTAK